MNRHTSARGGGAAFMLRGVSKWLLAMLCAAWLSHGHAQSGASSSASASITGVKACMGKPVDGTGPTECTSSSKGPINFITGNKHREEVDLAPLPGVLGLELIRYYNSTLSKPDNAPGLMGRGWRLSYETSLSFGAGPGAGYITVNAAEGSSTQFNARPSAPDEYTNADALQGKIIHTRSRAGDIYTWFQAGAGKRGGKRLTFNAQGLLVQIMVPTGEFVSLQYDAGSHLVRVTDPQNRSLRISYLSKGESSAGGRFRGIQAVDMPVGRFTYEYGSPSPAGYTGDKRALLANLVKVNYPIGLAGAGSPQAGDSRQEDPRDRVLGASSLSRIYAYEDPRFATFLTGISLAGVGADHKRLNARIGSYAYDEHGRANLSVAGWPAKLQTGADGKPLQPARLVPGTGQDQVVLDYSIPHQTTLINALGQQSVYKHTGLDQAINGQGHMLSATGPGCSVCPPSNIKYEYDAAGHRRSYTQLNSQGQPLVTIQSDLDEWGRVKSENRIAYVKGRAQAPRRLARYEYASADEHGVPLNEPALIATPSVVAGQEHQVRITYNDAGQPLQVTETGYQPQIADQAAQQLTRTTIYTYQTINGRSVLRQVDGPLANGPRHSPTDSDITIYAWDRRADFVERVLAPGEQATRFARRNEAGQVILELHDDGSRYSEVSYTPSWLGVLRRQVSAWQRLPDGRLIEDSRISLNTQYNYDALGHLVDIRRADGTHVRTSMGADGKPLSLTLPDGSQVIMQRDTQGQLTWLRRVDPQGKALQTIELHQNLEQQLTAIGDDLGLIASFEYSDGDGGSTERPSSVRNAMGARTDYVYDTLGFLTQKTQAVGLPERRVINWWHDASGNVMAELHRGLPLSPAQSASGFGFAQSAREALYDDFGNKIVQSDVAHGLVRYVWDAANRLVAQANESGVVARNTYDAAGRLVAQGVNEQGQITQWRYDGHLPVLVQTGKDQHYSDITQWHYDALGRKVEQRQWNADALPPRGAASDAAALQTVSDTNIDKASPSSGQGIATVTLWTYDERGRLKERTLLDASGKAQRTGYVWDASTGQLSSITHNGQTIASNIHTSSLGGLTQYTAANGLVEHFDRDARGRLVHQGLSTAEGVILDVKYGYDAANRLTHFTQQAASAAADAATGKTSVVLEADYQYDALGRLVSQKTNTGTYEAYTYDAQDNRLLRTREQTRQHIQESPSPITEAYSYRGQRLIAVQDRSGYIYNDLGLPYLQIKLGEQLDSKTAMQTRQVSAPSDTQPNTHPQSDQSRPQQSLATNLEYVRYSSSGQPLAVIDADHTVRVQYTYSDAGQRSAKIIREGHVTHTTRYIYEQTPTGPRLMAEADTQGRITRQYIYLDETQDPCSPSRLIAVADTVPPSDQTALQRLWSATQNMVLGWFNKSPDAITAVYVVHTDQRYAPTLVTDSEQRVIWAAQYDAFGAATVAHPQKPILQASSWTWLNEAHAQIAGEDEFTLNIRLPGQYFDAETGLHHNMQRSYDPHTGRYLTPDPLSTSAYLDLGQIEKLAGVNAYGYVGGDPLDYTDSQGLYEEDIHYYMTFFLALAAGVSYDDAKVIALADQYVDDNPDTKPLDESTLSSEIGSITKNTEALVDYHFALSGSTGKTVAAANTSDYKNPGSPQLQNLQSSVNNAPTPCAKRQFFGEYLHAFEDTFGHRNPYDKPIDATWDLPTWNSMVGTLVPFLAIGDPAKYYYDNHLYLGIGHGLYGKQPDMTYDESTTDFVKASLLALPGSEWGLIGSDFKWDTREARTLEMEKEVFAKIGSTFSSTPKIGMSSLEGILKEFNSIQENDMQTGNGDKTDIKNGNGKFYQKLTILNKALAAMKITRPDGKPIDFLVTAKSDGEGYDPDHPIEACKNRDAYLRDKDGNYLDPAKFVGTILPKSAVVCK